MENYLKSNLEVIRERKNLSQNALAELLDVNQSNIVRWEAGTRTPSIDNVIHISEVLGIPLDILVGKDLRIEKNVILDENHKLDLIIKDKTKNFTEEDWNKVFKVIDLVIEKENK